MVEQEIEYKIDSHLALETNLLGNKRKSTGHNFVRSVQRLMVKKVAEQRLKNEKLLQAKLKDSQAETV